MDDKWQPIETAPKDGTEILACDVSGDLGAYHVEVVFWAVSWGDDSDTVGWGICDGQTRPPSCFTHWMPLPEPPDAP